MCLRRRIPPDTAGGFDSDFHCSRPSLIVANPRQVSEKMPITGGQHCAIFRQETQKSSCNAEVGPEFQRFDRKISEISETGFE
jgi:hypothetical protein